MAVAVALAQEKKKATLLCEIFESIPSYGRLGQSPVNGYHEKKLRELVEEGFDIQQRPQILVDNHADFMVQLFHKGDIIDPCVLLRKGKVAFGIWSVANDWRLLD